MSSGQKANFNMTETGKQSTNKNLANPHAQIMLRQELA